MLCGWWVKERSEWIVLFWLWMLQLLHFTPAVSVSQCSIQSNENTNRRNADTITSAGNRRSEDEERLVSVISQSSCPSALAPVLLGEGDRTKHRSLAPGLCNTCMPHQDQANHSVTSPTHALDCHCVLFSHIWYYSLPCQKTMRLQLVCLCTCISVWEWDKLTLLLTHGWASWTRLWVIECGFYTEGMHRIS